MQLWMSVALKKNRNKLNFGTTDLYLEDIKIYIILGQLLTLLIKENTAHTGPIPVEIVLSANSSGREVSG